MRQHQRSLRPLVVLLAAALSSNAARAQVLIGPGSATASPAIAVRALPERLVGIAVGSDINLVAASVGAVVLDRIGDGISPLGIGGPGTIGRLGWRTHTAAARGARGLAIRPDVTFVEMNVRASQDETSDCGVVGQASTQQCTVAFFDATPTLPEYTQQGALPAIDLGGIGPSVSFAETLVAVIDTGVDPAHSALAGRLADPGYDFILERPGGFEVANGIDDDGDGFIDEGHGHGTHAAGVITLIDPDAFIIPFRVLDDEGVGTAWDVARAIRAADDADVHFINLSVGLAAPSDAVLAALDDVDDEIVIFASAGNRGGIGVGALARKPNVVAVAAVDNTGVLPAFASYGPEVQLVAPGVDVYGPMPNERWARWSGSSMSTAIASVAGSRLHSWRMDEEPDEVLEAMLQSALPVDGRNPQAAGLLGSGLIRIGAAAQQL